MRQKIISIVLFLIAGSRIILFIVENKGIYLRKYDHKAIGKIYSSSQYIQGPVPERPIGDDDLYAFAGYYYLVQRGDISQVNFENPPLAKYLIGLSILLFGNAKVISIFYGLILLFLTYKISFHLFNPLLGAFSVLLLSWNPLFLDQLTGNLLDLPMTLFLISGIYFYLKGKKKLFYLYLSSLMFGLAFSSKFFPALLLIIGILTIDAFRSKKRFFILFLKALTIVPSIYLLSNVMYFYYHPSFVEFLKYQRWIINWRLGNPFIVGNIVNTIFLKKYQSWWDPKLYVIYNNWSIFSPLIPLLSFLSPLFARKTKRSELLLLWSISLTYFLYVFFATTGVEKYLLPVYPLMVILSVSLFYSLFKQIIISYNMVKIWKN